MKFSTSSVALLSAAALSSANPLLQNRAVCNADNCARAVTGTNAQPAAVTRRSDCSSFQLVTVTPAPSTFTAPNPITTTIFVGDSAAAAKRQATDGAITVSPSAVPAYAASCSGTSRYASACSCFGITKTTTTVATPTVTVTGAEPTATVVPGPRPVCGSTVQGEGPCGCTYTVSCNQQYVGGRVIATLNTISESDCVNSCDRFDNCFNVNYNRRTGECEIFQRADDVQPLDDDDAYVFANTCTSDGSNPQCIQA